MPRLNQKGVAHIFLILILFLGIIGGVYLVTSGNPLKIFPKAFNNQNSIENLTQELVALNNKEGRSAQDTEKESKMLALAIQRKELLKELADNNPEEFLKLATLVNNRSDFPKSVQPLIEEEKEITGTAEVIFSDPKEGEEVKKDLLVRNSEGIVRVHLSPEFKAEGLGENISAIGVVIEGEAVIKDTLKLTSTQRYAAAGVKGVRKVAVILANFSDDKSNPVTQGEINNLLFSSDNSLKSFIKTASFNKVEDVVGDIYDGINLNYPNKDCEVKIDPKQPPNFQKWMDDAQNQIKSKIGESQYFAYNNWILILPRVKSCYGVAKSTLYLMPDPALLPGKIWVYDFQKSLGVYTHEFGHNMGLNHSNLLSCGTKQIDIPSNCESKEYEDYSSAMTYFNNQVVQYHALNKLALGWIPKENVLEVTTDGTFTIEPPSESIKTSTQILKIPIKDTKESYYISYRKKAAFNTDINNSFLEGASVHIWDGVSYNQTKLINTNPTQGTATAALQDKKFFYDPIKKILITQLSHTEDSVTLSIKLNQEGEPVPPQPQNNYKWDVTVKTSCPYGKEPATRLYYAVWPPGPLSWKESFKQGDHNLQIDANNNAAVSGIYILLETEDGKTLTASKGLLPHKAIQFEKYFNPPTYMVKWQKDELPSGNYTVTFDSKIGNTDICRP